ncbi:MAG: hypothetical protein U5N21_02800 [Rhodococcus sp. (in: high G+C Gram-positive bacteria)]|nr:hypothetical protein [Rhodococcus sp. (in: high G+C Gram-positive bacteria)]
MPQEINTTPPKRHQVFVISPIGAVGTETHANALLALEYIIKKALPEDEFEIRRADFEHAPDSITQMVVKRIIEADLIVADLTGHNPNVFYELAIAHSFKRPVVIITTEGTPAPFDITDQRYIAYNLANPASIYASQERLLTSARYALKHPEELHTPVSEYAKAVDRTSRAVSGDGDALVELFEGLQDRLGSIEGTMRAIRAQSQNSGYPPQAEAITADGKIRRSMMLPDGTRVSRLMTAHEWAQAEAGTTDIATVFARRPSRSSTMFREADDAHAELDGEKSDNRQHGDEAAT